MTLEKLLAWIHCITFFRSWERLENHLLINIAKTFIMYASKNYEVFYDLAYWLQRNVGV